MWLSWKNGLLELGQGDYGTGQVLSASDPYGPRLTNGLVLTSSEAGRVEYEINRSAGK